MDQSLYICIAPKNWCFWTVVLEKTLESLLDCKGIQPVPRKGNQSWILLEGLMLKLKLQHLAIWCEEVTHLKRSWCWERLKAGGEGMAEDEIVGRHHQLNGREFEWAPWVGDGQGGLACCIPSGHREAEWLNWTEQESTSCIIKPLARICYICYNWWTCTDIIITQSP